ncbi:MAG: hypothetical protein CVV03_03185 [Firmicutes bacterium HGW-Firmicutes-8]|nr:MAG: hypothetical protein CVV03_03185 [Firmicutes bacterium HGW-Firmicutes-8]
MTNIEVETLLRQNKVPYTFMEDGYWRLNCGDYVILMFHNEESEFLRFVMPLLSVPQENREEVYRCLLELNCTGVFCGSFAIHPDSDSIIYLDQIPTIDLEFSEIMATLNSFVHIIDNHLTNIKKIYGGE